MEKEEAKQKLIELIEKHQRFKNEGRLKGINEENTKDWIDELFRILGWNYIDEVKKEYGTGKRKRVDYAFQINGTTKFLLEAKAYNEELKDEHIGQALQYGYSNNKTWVVLSNFREIRVYNAKYYDQPEHIRRLYEPLRIEDAIARFDDLWVLSEEGMKNNLINQLANKYGKIKPKEPITTLFFEDLMEWRKALEKAIKEHSRLNAIPADEEAAEKRISEAVQKILDRIIFIRVCEDRGLEEEGILEWCVKEWQANKKYSLMSYLSRQFQKKDAEYNSGLFARHYSEDLTIDNEVIERIITETYHSSSGLSYDFSAMDADILGTVYENYLAYIQKKVWNKESKQKSKRKAQGIYYTPTYIVDYIVKNTLGEKLKECKTPEDALKIRVLDPACGSGSFLIRAYDEFKQWFAARNKGEQTKLNVDNEKGMQTFMDKVLENCIYGVDLDDKAVEITQLNLLLKAAEGKHKLPTLSHTIQCGNSLIDDPTVAGDKAFKWEERFPEVFKNGGFDVVVGNPPYVKARDTKDTSGRIYLENSGKFNTLYKMWDLYVPFVETGLKFLKNTGKFGMIIPDTIGLADYTQKLVDFINNDFSLYQIDFFPGIFVFEGVGVQNKIIFVENTKNKECRKIIHKNRIDNAEILSITKNKDATIFKLEESKINLDFEDTVPLGNLCYVSYGARFNSDKTDPMKFKKTDLLAKIKDAKHERTYVEGKYLERYNVKKEAYVEWGTERCPKRLVRPTFPELYTNQKLLLSRQKRLATISPKPYVCDNTIIVGVPYHILKGVNNSGIERYFSNIQIERTKAERESLDFSLSYLLAIINSKLISYFLNFKSTGKIDTYPDDWKLVPIKKLNSDKQKPFAVTADKMISLNVRLNELQDKNSNEAQRLRTEIEKTDAEIDQLVYKLYGLTEDEIKIVEEAVK